MSRWLLVLALVASPTLAHAQAVLSVTPTSLTASGAVGSSVPSQALRIRNGGRGALKWWIVAPSVSWLTVTPLQGTNSGTITVAFKPAGLSADVYETTFRISAGTQTQLVSVALTLTPPPPLPPPPDLPPPLPTISLAGPLPVPCPAGALAVGPSENIGAVFRANPPGTSYCIKGQHNPTSPIELQAGDTVNGEYGSLVNGSAVTRTWDVGGIAIFSGWNCSPGCGNVTLRNLTIIGRGDITCIGVSAAPGNASDNWTIDHNEVSGCSFGISHNHVTNTRITFNLSHHNVFGGIAGYTVTGSRIEDNETTANGGSGQKISISNDVQYRRHYSHDEEDGTWFDGDNVNCLVEDGRYEYLTGTAIFIEISGKCIVRRNRVTNSQNAIFTSTSRDGEYYDNDLIGNFRGHQYFLNCDAVGGGTIPGGWDLTNNRSWNTRTTVTTPNAWAAAFSYASACPSEWKLPNGTTARLSDYISNAKNNRFETTQYTLPNLTGGWWVWGQQYQTWSQWLARGQDVGGTVQ